VADAPIVITGHAYGRRATLEVSGDTLMWRAQRGARQIAENIATTIHDVRNVRWLDLAWSRGGIVLCGLGAMWAASENFATGIAASAVGAGLVLWRHLRPRHYLVLDVGDRRLVMQVAGVSAPSARALSARIRLALERGEPPPNPPALP
jgi:predicted dienelactone hydrolase